MTTTKLIRKKMNPLFVEFLKTPFDEEDLKRLYKSSMPTNSLSELAMVFGVIRAGEILDKFYPGALKKLIKVIDKDLITYDDYDFGAVEDADTEDTDLL